MPDNHPNYLVSNYNGQANSKATWNNLFHLAQDWGQFAKFLANLCSFQRHYKLTTTFSVHWGCRRQWDVIVYNLQITYSFTSFVNKKASTQYDEYYFLSHHQLNVVHLLIRIPRRYPCQKTRTRWNVKRELISGVRSLKSILHFVTFNYHRKVACMSVVITDKQDTCLSVIHVYNLESVRRILAT